MRRKYAWFGLRFCAIATLFFFVAGCSGGQQPLSQNATLSNTATTAGTGTTIFGGTTTTTTGATTTNTPTGGATYTTNTGPYTGSPQSLFDTTISPNEQPTGATYIEGSVSGMSQCLTNDSALGLGQSSEVNSTCIGATQGYDPSALYEGAVTSYGMLNDCLNLVLSNAPASNADSNTVALAFEQAQLALIRCYRRMLYEQQNYLPWGQGPTVSYNNLQNTLFQIEVMVPKGGL